MSNNKLESFLISGLFPVLQITDFLSGFVGGIWLLFSGSGGAVLSGLLFMAFGSFILGLLLMPSFIFIAPLSYFSNRNNTIGIGIFGFLASLYTSALMVIGSIWIINLLVNRASVDSPNFIVLLWCFGVAIAPWAYMASKEDKNSIGTILPIMFLKTGLLAILVVCGIFGMELRIGYIILSCVMFVYTLIAIVMAILENNEEAKYKRNFSDNEVIEAEVIEENTELETKKKNEEITALAKKTVELIKREGKISAALIQREFKVSYAKSLPRRNNLGVE